MRTNGKQNNHDKTLSNTDEQRKSAQPYVGLSHHQIPAAHCLDNKTAQGKSEQQEDTKMNMTEQDCNNTKNILRDIAEWVLVVIAFGLVAFSLYHMGIFDWLNA